MTYRFPIILILTLIVFVMLPSPVNAEEAVNEESEMPSLEERKARLNNFDLALPHKPSAEVGTMAPATVEHYEKALKGYYEYRQAGYDHRLTVFEWQLFSSKVIFAVVLIVVFSGIYFAAVQFHRGLHRAPGDVKKEGEEVTEIVMSIRELKVRSPVLGVVILTLSLGFFYLYLVYVYPIVNVF